MSEGRDRNKIIRFPVKVAVKVADEKVPNEKNAESVIVQKQISRAIKDGKAELIDISTSGDGMMYDLYRLDMNGQVTYIFDVKS